MKFSQQSEAELLQNQTFQCPVRLNPNSFFRIFTLEYCE